ncbi:MAG: hypothetical protein MI750_01010 [Xanthomonadales bacterium]|nr:hypothetical protein [Xanthomonadales bacterium]
MTYPTRTPILTRGIGLTATIADHIAIGYDGALPTAGGQIAGVCEFGGDSGDYVSVTSLGLDHAVSGAAIPSVGLDLKVDAAGKFIPQGGAGTVVARSLSTASAADQPVAIEHVRN